MKLTKPFRFAALALVFLAGCQSQSQQSARLETIQWLERRGYTPEQAKIVSNDPALLQQALMDYSSERQDEKACREMGAAPGTQAYIQCRNMRYVGRPKVQPSQASQNEPRNCVTREVYGVYRTTCY